MLTTTQARKRIVAAFAAMATALTLSATPAHADNEPAPRIQAGLQIQNVRTGLCMDLPGFGNGAIGDPVTQWYCNPGPADNQMWRLLDYDDGTYAVQNVKNGFCLDVPFYGPVPAATNISMYYCNLGPADNQMFYVDWVGNGSLFRHAKNPDLCLDVAGPNGSGGPDARLTLWPCSLDDDHVWALI